MSNDTIYCFAYKNGDRESGAYTVYRYHDLPCHLLGFYLCEKEIRCRYFKTRSTVKHCSVKVPNKTAVIKFGTTATGSHVGNNNLGLYLRAHDPDVAFDRMGYFVDKEGKKQSNDALIRDVFWGKHLSEIAKDAYSNTITGDINIDMLVQSGQLSSLLLKYINTLDSCNFSIGNDIVTRPQLLV